MKKDSLRTLTEKLKKYRYPALILALGLLLLLFPTGKKPAEEAPEATQETAFDLAAFTEEVEDALSQVKGAGELKLVLSLESGGSHSYLANRTEMADPSGQRQTEYVLRDADGEELPVLVEYGFPGFRGAVVVCQGADSPAVAYALKEALSGLVGLGMDKITILEMR